MVYFIVLFNLLSDVLQKEVGNEFMEKLERTRILAQVSLSLYVPLNISFCVVKPQSLFHFSVLFVIFEAIGVRQCSLVFACVFLDGISCCRVCLMRRRWKDTETEKRKMEENLLLCDVLVFVNS